MKKAALLFFGILIIFGMVFAVQATESPSETGFCGDSVQYSLYPDKGELIIIGTGDMYDYDYSSTPWHFYADDITKVVMSGNINYIGSYCFGSFSELKEFIIPDSVESIGSNAFDGCDALTDITIPNSVKSIGEYAFSSCYALTDITIGDSVESFGSGVFSGCPNLEKITVSEDNKNYISDEKGVLFNKQKTQLILCPPKTNLTEYSIPGSVTNIESYAFEDCSSLTSIEIPNSVTNIGSFAFQSCERLTSVTIPNSVTSIGSCAFRYCERLASVTIGNSVTSIGMCAFEECSSLTSVTIPDGVTRITRYTFSYCSGLKSVTIPDSVTSIIGTAFIYCESLEYVYYKGTKEQWENISISSSGNDPLLNATIIYGYEPAQTTTTVTNQNNKTSFEVETQGIENGNVVYIAFYLNQKLVDVQSKVCDGSDVSFVSDKEYDVAKVMTFSALNTFSPLTKAETITFSSAPADN